MCILRKSLAVGYAVVRTCVRVSMEMSSLTSRMSAHAYSVFFCHPLGTSIILATDMCLHTVENMS